MNVLEEMQALVTQGCEIKVGGYKGTKSGSVIWSGHISRDGDLASRYTPVSATLAGLLESLLAEARRAWPELLQEAP